MEPKAQLKKGDGHVSGDGQHPSAVKSASGMAPSEGESRPAMIPAILHTNVEDCPVKSRSHEAHDALIANLMNFNANLEKRVKVLDGVVKMTNAQNAKLRADLKALLDTIKAGPDRTSRVLASYAAELEKALQELKAKTGR